MSRYFNACLHTKGRLGFNWGSLSAPQMVQRFWWAAAAGAYGMHGEMLYKCPYWSNNAGHYCGTLLSPVMLGLFIYKNPIALWYRYYLRICFPHWEAVTLFFFSKINAELIVPKWFDAFFTWVGLWFETLCAKQRRVGGQDCMVQGLHAEHNAASTV